MKPWTEARNDIYMNIWNLTPNLHTNSHSKLWAEKWTIMQKASGSSMWSPCNANVWQNSGLTWAVSWANQCELQAISMIGKTVVLHGQLYGVTSMEPCNSNEWQDSVLIWALSWVDQCKPHALPMYGKTVAFHVQFYGPTRVNPM